MIAGCCFTLGGIIMNTFLRAGILSCAVLSTAVSPALAETQPAADAASKPVDDKASNFVHCDGKPNKESSLGIAARVVALSLVVGLLIPPPEEPDAKKRMTGQDGIKACDAALNGDEKASDGGRRLELILGRAVHRMEISDWQGAIDDIHSLPVDQPQLTSTRAYRQSLGQTAAYLEAISLEAKGDGAGAAALGYRIGEESPYDPYTVPLAIRLILPQDGYGPEKKQLLDRAVRLNPMASLSRAGARAGAGDFSGAGDDFSAIADLLGTIPTVPSYAARGQAAIGYRLAGKAQTAEDLMSASQKMVDADAADGKHAPEIDSYREASDFYTIVKAMDDGQAVRARNMFSAHSHWRSVNYGYVMEMARRLQSVGTVEEQAMSPIQTPAQILGDYNKAIVAAVTSRGDKGDQYWHYFIPANSDAAYGKFSENVWRGKNSRYINKTPDKDVNAQLVDTRSDGTGIPCAYALYMHLAVVAKAQGKTGFMVLPAQRNLCAVYFRIGNADDKDMIAPFMANADQVIADLSTYFPNPDTARGN